MAGKVHRLSCDNLRPLSSRFITGGGGWLAPDRLVCHCLLVETDYGLLLVDTSFGPGDLAVPDWQLWAYGLAARRSRDRDEMAVRQITRLVLDPRNVRHTMLAHF